MCIWWLLSFVWGTWCGLCKGCWFLVSSVLPVVLFLPISMGNISISKGLLTTLYQCHIIMGGFSIVAIRYEAADALKRYQCQHHITAVPSLLQTTPAICLFQDINAHFSGQTRGLQSHSHVSVLSHWYPYQSIWLQRAYIGDSTAMVHMCEGNIGH